MKIDEVKTYWKVSDRPFYDEMSEDEKTEIRKYSEDIGLPYEFIKFSRNTEEIIYRKAVAEDCHELSILKRDVWNTTYQGIYPQEKLDNYDVQKNEEILKGIVLNPEIDLYVAQKQKKLLGFMTCGKPYRLFNEYNQEVALLYILKEFQRRGIGRHFIELAKEETRKKGFDEFILSVNSKNENAIAFYLAMGGIIICDDGGQKRFLFKV